jgi:hypothetical protein
MRSPIALAFLALAAACGGIERAPDADPPPPSAPCRARLAADGVRRCLPDGAEGTEYFRPGFCGAAPLAVVPDGTRAGYILTSAVVPHLDAPPWSRVFDGARPSLDVRVCQWHGAACACRDVQPGEDVYASELDPASFPPAP